MEVLRKVIEDAAAQLIIDLPESYHNRKLEVIVLPLEEHIKDDNSKLPTTYDYSNFYGKVQWKGDAIAEQRRLRDEWE